MAANNRSNLLKNAKKNGVKLKITYPYMIHKMKFFTKFKNPNLKTTEKLSKKIFSLPTFPELTKRSLHRPLLCFLSHIIGAEGVDVFE